VVCGSLLAFERRGLAATIAADGHSTVSTSLTILLVCGGVLILMGFVTAIAASVLGFIEGVWAACSAITSPNDNWLHPVLIFGTLATVVLTGPGGFSLDAYFFGPKSVEIPVRKQQTNGGAL